MNLWLGLELGIGFRMRVCIRFRVRVIVPCEYGRS